jgi:small subunit ribosomal protein S6e
MKLVVSDPKTGKTYQTEIAKDKESALIGLKIGDTFDGGAVGAAGYKLMLTGGSDKEGFPMRKDMKGSRRKQILISSGIGIRQMSEGARRKKAVRGSVISDQIMQVNSKAVEYGEKKLEEIFPPTKKEEKK